MFNSSQVNAVSTTLQYIEKPKRKVKRKKLELWGSSFTM